MVLSNADNLIFEKVLIVGVRDYYKNSLGKPGVGDRNYYDDAMFILTGGKLESFNFNVDPSRHRKGIATLKAGLYSLVKHRHRGRYPALQIELDVVIRDGQKGTDTGRHGINFHYGGDDDTWSLGCQTCPRKQWLEFQPRVYALMDKFKLHRVKYLLVEGT